MRLICLGLLIFNAAFLGCRSERRPKLSMPLEDGRWQAAALEPVDAARVAQLAEDGPVVVALWASWCKPCIAEMPELDAFARAHPEVLVLGLATEPISDPGRAGQAAAAAAQAVLDRVRPTYPQGLLASGVGPFLGAWSIEWDGMLPKTLALGRAGTHVLPTPVTRASLEAALVPDQAL